MANSGKRLIISIDFGTTYSGVAYAYTQDYKEADYKCQTDALPNKSATNKIPSLISYDQNNDAMTWGSICDDNIHFQSIKQHLDPDSFHTNATHLFPTGCAPPEYSQGENLQQNSLARIPGCFLDLDLMQDWPGLCDSSVRLGSASTPSDSTLLEISDELLSDEIKVDDCHVIFSLEDFQQPPTGKPECSLLHQLFSVPTCCDDARYLRCSQSQLEDLASWLLWQRCKANRIAPKPNWIFAESEEGQRGLSEEELLRCRSILLRLLQSRSVEEMQLVFLAVYFVTHSFRSLSTSEWIAAVRGIAEARLMHSDQCIGETGDDFPYRKLLDMCSPLLKPDHNDQIVFEESAMEKYLKSVELPGIERGHGTMTQMCFDQIKRLGTAVIVQPWYSFCSWFKSCSEWPLIKYVLDFWFSHYKIAADSRHDLTAELFRMINDAFVGRSPTETPLLLQQKVVDAGHSLAQIYDLPLLVELYRNLGASSECSSPTSSWSVLVHGAKHLWHSESSSDIEIYSKGPGLTSSTNITNDMDDSDFISSRLSCTHLTSCEKGQALCDSMGQEWKCSSPLSREWNWEKIRQFSADDEIEPEHHIDVDDWECIKNHEFTFT